MTWNSKYWDIVNDFYWVPTYLGLKSISKSKWVKQDGLICVPSELVNRTGPLYTRERKADDNAEHLKRQEEILNHMFNLTFGIAGDSVVRKLLFEPLGFEDHGPFHSLGREVATRYGWGNRNVTQQDGLFVTPRSIVGVELKTISAVRAEQILKYVLMMCCEEHESGPKSNVGLLFIVPEISRATLWQKCRVSKEGQIDASFLNEVPRRDIDKCLRGLRQGGEDAFKSMLDRLQLASISWFEMDQSMGRIMAHLDPGHAGDQTLSNLFGGFRAQIADHVGTGVCLENARD